MKYVVRKINTVTFGEMKGFLKKHNNLKFFSTTLFEFAISKISHQDLNVSGKVTDGQKFYLIKL